MRTLTKLLWILLLGVVFSCQDNVIDAIDATIDEKNFDTKMYETSVSVEDARNVAELFTVKDAPRTRVSKSVKEIITIEGEVNKPSMYIINYDNEQGFLLVSATKNFQPILAYAERGSFNANNRMPDGLSDWLGDMKNVIEERDKMPIDSTFQYRAMWEEYIPAMKDKVYTRYNIAEFENYIADCCREWKKEGYGYIPFAGARDYLPESIYEQFRAVAEGMTYIEYDYNQHAYLRWKQKGYEEKMGNILSTTWTQESGFNVALPQISGQYPPAGCATIAMAQVMKYNEYPTFFNWNSMPNSYASSVTAAFIRDVADAINADYALDGTSASLSDVRNALVSKYGYSTTAQVVNHSAARTIGNLRKKQPVIMQGFTDDGKVGHAWVACGYHDIDHYTEYELLTMPEEFHPGGTFVFLISDSYTTDFDIRTYFYMNWGWGGSYNGMYLDTNLYLERSDGSFSWNRNRKDIVDIVPK